jgi:hypothetical protein
MNKYIFIAPDLIQPIDEETLLKDIFDVDFNGNYLVQIANEKGIYKIANAMNGWGDNCLSDFDRPVLILTTAPTANMGREEAGWIDVTTLPQIVDKKAKPVLVRYLNSNGKAFHALAYYFPDRFKTVEWEEWDDYSEEDFPYTENDAEAGTVWLRAGWYQGVECDKCEGYWSSPLDVTEWMPIPPAALDQSRSASQPVSQSYEHAWEDYSRGVEERSHGLDKVDQYDFKAGYNSGFADGRASQPGAAGVGFMPVLVENYEAAKRSEESLFFGTTKKEAVLETYEDLISIYKSKYNDKSK